MGIADNGHRLSRIENFTGGFCPQKLLNVLSSRFQQGFYVDFQKPSQTKTTAMMTQFQVNEARFNPLCTLAHGILVSRIFGISLHLIQNIFEDVVADLSSTLAPTTNWAK